MGELEKQEGIDVSGGRSVVARSQRGHPIFGFDGPRGDRPVFGFHPVKDHAICGSPKRGGKGRASPPFSAETAGDAPAR